MNNGNKNNSRVSIMYFTDSEGLGDPILDFSKGYYLHSYINMLAEDIRMSIISTYKFESSYNVVITPLNDEIEKIIASALSEYDSSLESAIRDFFQDCALKIAAFGEAIYEIVYFFDEEGKIINFELVPIPPMTVTYQKGKFYQYIPEVVADKLNITQYIELPTENLAIFRLSKDLDEKLENTRKKLINVSNLPSPVAMALKNIDSNNSNSYDFERHANTEKLVLAEAGTSIGWNVRFSLDEEITEYYLLYRSLEFEKFIIEFRNNILQILNEIIGDIGKKMDFNSKIIIEGLPSIENINDLKTQLEKGEKSFKDIVNLNFD